jgi:PAS domain S-box-containing protein
MARAHVSRNGEKQAVLSASKQAIAQAALAPGPHAVVSADREGKIRDWNETAEHIFGHSAGQAIGQTLYLVIPEEERADHWRNFRRVMATGVLNYRPDHVLDIEGLRRDGTRVMLDAALIAILDGAEILSGSQPSYARRTVILSRDSQGAIGVIVDPH